MHGSSWRGFSLSHTPICSKPCMRLLKTFPDSRESDEAAALLGYYTAKDGDTVEALKLYKGYLKMNPDSENAEWVRKRITDLEAE